MAPAGQAAAPAGLLLLLSFLPTQAGPAGEANTTSDVQTSVLTKNNLKGIITLLDHQIQVLHQKHSMHEHDLTEKQDRLLTVHMNVLQGTSVTEKTTTNIATTQEPQLPNKDSVLVSNKLHKIFPNIHMDTPVNHNKVKSAGSEENNKGRSLIPGLKQDKNAASNGGSSVRTTNISIRFHSTDNSSKTQIDIFNLKDSRETPEVHIVTSNVINEDIKTNSVTLEDNGLQVMINSSVNKNVKHVPDKGRKAVIKHDHGMTVNKSSQEGAKINLHVTALNPLKTDHMGKPTTPSLFFEKRNPKDVLETFAHPLLQLNQVLLSLKEHMVAVTHKDSSQSMRQQSESSTKELENILNDLKRESGKLKPLSPNEKMKSSVIENILKELKEHKDSGERDSTENKSETLMDSFAVKEHTLQVSNEPPLTQPLKTSPSPNIRTEVTNEDMKDAKRFEFFEKYEDIQDKKRTKASDLKNLLKHIIIACVAVTGLILAVILFVHIYTSGLLKKKKQKPVKTSEGIIKQDKPDTSEFTSVEEKENQQLEGDSTDIENQNNNNLSSPSAVFPSPDLVAENGEDPFVEPLEVQPVENISSNSPSKKNDLFSPAEPLKYERFLQEPPNCCSSSYHSMCENLKLPSQTFETNPTSCTNPNNQDKDRVLNRNNPNQQKFKPSRGRSKSTKLNRGHTHFASKHRCYSNSSWGDDSSSDGPVAADAHEKTNESKLSQFGSPPCACFQHLKGPSSTDSYSD